MAFRIFLACLLALYRNRSLWKKLFLVLFGEASENDPVAILSICAVVVAISIFKAIKNTSIRKAKTSPF
jgi:hypothetical protein